jgi:hypothetical protein
MRVVHGRVRVCLLASSHGLLGSHPMSSHLLHCAYCLSAPLLRPRPACRQYGIGAAPGRLRRPSMSITSMIMLGGVRPAPNDQRLYQVWNTVAIHPRRRSYHRLSHARHDRLLAFQPEDQARPRGSGLGVAGSPPPPPIPCQAPTLSGASPGAPPRWSASRTRDRVYVPVRLARHLYTCDRPVPWPDVNLPAQWHLNSPRVPVPPVPLEGQERLDHCRCSRRVLHLRGHAARPGWSPGTRGLELRLRGRRPFHRS